MKEKIKNFNKILNTALNFPSRILVIIAAFVLIPVLFTPMWHLSFDSVQYPEGLELYIYSNSLVGGNDGNDLTEINILNHYIGMAELKEEDFTEFKWIPLILGLMIVLTLRSVVIGTFSTIIDILVFFGYFSLFSFWRFWYMLSSYGHKLDPRAAVNVEPFTPPLFGTKMVGQFTVTSYPSYSVIFFALFLILLVLAVLITYRQENIQLLNKKVKERNST
jgi:copper chaperone NosL